MFHIKKKNPKYVSFHSALHPVPQRTRGEKTNGVPGEWPITRSALHASWGWLLLSHPAGKCTPGSLSPPGRPPHISTSSRHPPGIISTSQPRFPDCFTSCCQEFSTLRLTSTPCFHVLCFFFQVYSHHTLQKMATNQANDLEHCREGEKVRLATALCDLRYR